MKRDFFLLFGLVLTLGFFWIPPSPAQAIGLSPPIVEAPSVLRDLKQTKMIRVSRSPSEQGDVHITVEKSGEYARYLNAPTETTILKGQNFTEYFFDIYPASAATGNYEVKLTFKVAPVAQPDLQKTGNISAQVAVITGAAAIIRFTVSGEEVIDYEILGVSGADTEIGRPAYVKFFLSNLGNVNWKPSRIDLTFTDVNDPTNAVTASLKEGEIPLLEPGKENNVLSFEIPLNLIEGKYVLNARFFSQNEGIGEFVSPPFFVYPEGTLQQLGELVSIGIDKTSYGLGEKIKFNAIFKNVGSIPMKGVLNTDIYLGSDFIDMLRGEELSVGVNEEAVFSEVIEPDRPGGYRLSSFIKYGNKKSETQTINFTVIAPENKTLAFLNSKLGLIGLVFFILFVTIFLKFHQRRQHLKKKSSKKIHEASVDNKE